MMTFTTLKFEKNDRVASLTLNRPEIRNAFDTVMIAELTGVFRALATMTDVSIVVLKGEGKSFCSGADLTYMKEMAGYTLEENLRDAKALDEMFWTLRHVPQAVVAKLHGHVMGGALGLTALCDMAAAVDGTKFCFSENRLGLVPAVISPYVLEKMNPGAARRYMLSAEVFGVWQAADAGLVEFVGGDAECDEFIATLTKNLSANGPEAVRTAKKLFRELGECPEWEDKRELTTKTISERRVSAEGQEGLKSFLEKRDPSWKVTT